MGVYRRAVFERLQLECSRTKKPAFERTWLLDMLRAPGVNWTLYASRTREVRA